MERVGSGRCGCGCGGLTAIASRTDTRKGWVKGQSKRFLVGHYGRTAESRAAAAERGAARHGTAHPLWRGSAEERFVHYSGEPDKNGCIPWTGPCYSVGYGRIRAGREEHYAHRFAYERRFGAIPEGETIHHECENKLCVNVEHMRVLPRGEHTRMHRLNHR